MQENTEDFGPYQAPTMSDRDAERLERRLNYRDGLQRMLSTRPHQI